MQLRPGCGSPQAQARLIHAPHLLIFPSVFLVAAVLGFVLLGEGLQRRGLRRD